MPAALAANLSGYLWLVALALLISLSACKRSEPERHFSDSFTKGHDFTVELNSAGDGLDISFNAQSDVSYKLARSSDKNCGVNNTDCADYLGFAITEDAHYSDSLPERTYYYKLSVSLPKLSEEISAQYPPLDPPSSLSASAGDRQITLSWQDVSGASSYNIYGAQTSGITPENYAILEGGLSAQGVVSPYILTGLSNGTTYYLVATAIDAGGIESTYSGEISATPIAPPSDNVVPVFTSASTANAAENSTSAFYTASANDANGDSISYSIPSGEDADLFTIDASSGVLSFRKPPDYENPSDSNSDNIYQLNLVASDGIDLSAVLALTVSVSNLSELQASYDLAADAVVIDYDLDFAMSEGATMALYRADEPMGTGTCSVLDGITACANGASWADAGIPSTDSISWSMRRHYQLDLSVDGAVIDSLFADVAVSEYLTMTEPALSEDGDEFNLGWQALTDVGSYSLYISTDADATSATEANWSNLEGSKIIRNITESSYLLHPDSNTTLYLALRATNSSGVSTGLAPLYLLDNIEYVSDGSAWQQATAAADWPKRSQHTSAEFDDKLWVLGGFDGSNRFNDIWYSVDGINWTEVAKGYWSERYLHTSVTFNSKLWVLGGSTSGSENDVWYSEDLTTWMQATAAAAWSGRYGHTSVVFDGKLWVLGGYDGAYTNDVWYSADGANWTQATASAGWSPRSNHSSAIFGGKLWVLGGYNGSRLNDVWYSTDGATWTQATNNAVWSERDNHSSVVFDDKLWVLGGYDGSNILNDTWHSADGINWQRVTAAAEWSERWGHSSLLFDGELWVLGGYDGNRVNDVWYSAGTSLDDFIFNSLDYDYEPIQNQAPTFTSTASTTIDENSLIVYTASGTDPDGGTLAFSIVGGADAALFAINSSSGSLSFIAAPDYENPTDSNSDNNYRITLQLSDGSARIELDLVISVKDVNENLSVPTGIQASVSDGEITLSWQMVDDASSYRVYWDTSSGVGVNQHLGSKNVSSNSASVSNLSDGTTYYFVVTSINQQGESAESEELGVSISVGINNSIPYFTSTAPTEVSENTVTAFYNASASDADGDQLSFAISGGADAELFHIGSANGELSFIAAPDYEAPTDSNGDNLYSLTLSVSDASAVALQSIALSVGDMAANADLQAEYAVSVNLISFNTESGLSYQLLRSYDANCDHQSIGACSGGVELEYVEANSVASASDSIDFTQTQYYSLLASDSAGRIETLTVAVDGAEQSDEFTAAHQLLVEYNLVSGSVDIAIDSFPDIASYTLYRADEPIGTATCSVLDGIGGCAHGASWSDTAIPSTDSIDWSARRYYQLDISSDGAVIGRLFADLAVSDYLTMAEPTVADSGYELNLSWQALPNAASYSLYVATDADATSATEANWSSLVGAQIINDIADANYSLDPEGATSLYVALSATNSSGATAGLSPLSLIDAIDSDSNDGSAWQLATDSAGWSARSSHTSVVFDNKLWVIGGYDGSSKLNDVWYSTDGLSWAQAAARAGWSGRTVHTSVVFDDKLWVIGGYDGSHKNDVWYSADGVNWTQATSSAGWSARYNHTSVVFNDKIWVLGGYGSGYRNDVWYSEDGLNWLQATSDAGWAGRDDHTNVVFDNKLWVLGGWDGSRFEDVWYSDDGVNWTQATSSAGWSARAAHTSVVFDNKLWVLGGWDGSRLKDVWYSTDGVNWTQATGSAGWSERASQTSVVFDNKLWILGGSDGSNRLNDVWHSTLNIIDSFAFTPIDYTSPQNQPPTFTSATSAIADENSLAAYSASGVDPDGGTLAFAITGGADAALFAIDSSSGELSFITSPDHEHPMDGDADNIYRVDLGIDDGSANGADLSLAVTVVNAIEFPTTPIAVQAVAGNSSATLSWQAINDARSYRVYWNTDGTPSASQHLASQEVSSNSVTISGLSNGTIYHFVVTALNSLGESPESTVLSVKPQSGATNQAPTAAAGADQTVSEGSTVYLAGSGSDTDGSLVHYSWSTNSSNITIVDSDSSDGAASFIAPEVDASGSSFTLTLTVTDDDQASASDTMVVMVENNEPPIVSVVDDQSAAAGTTVSLSGSASDSDGSVVAYLWQETSASIIASGGASIDRADTIMANFTIPTDLAADTALTFELSATDDDGATASAQTKVTVAASGSFKWSFTTADSIYSSPAIALNGTIYFGSDDGKLYALNPDGSEDWNYTTSNKVRSAPAIGADGTIYFGSDNGKLYALNSDGSEDWNYTTAGGVVRASPALGADGTIYFGSEEGKLYALNPDGSEDWNYSANDSIYSSPAISSEGMIYFGDSTGMVYELNSSGDLQRSFDSVGAIHTAIALDPANNQLYFSNRNGNIYALSTDSAASWASPLWSVAVKSLDSAPVIAGDGTIYIGSYDDQRLYALAADGSILSSKFYSNAGAINATATLGAGSRIYFNSGDGNLYALDASATTTTLDWQYYIGWSYTSTEPAASAAALASDGTVYVGSTDGNLYALHSASVGLATSYWPRFAHDNHNLGRTNITPSAEAGADQRVSAGATVALDGSNSSDPDGAIVDYYWRETSGYGVSITDNNSAQASFTAPTGLSSDAILTIQLTVTDNSGTTATDTLQVSVVAEL